jgi:hypothetical protein
VVLGLLVLADLGARRASEAQLEQRILDSAPSAHDASVHLDSFPFLGRLAVSGNVPEVRASVADVTVQGLRLNRIAVDLHDVHIDRDRLVVHRQIDLKSIGRGLATAEVTQADLRSALNGLPVVLGKDRISVTVRGVTATVTATVRDNVVHLSAGRLSIPPFSIPKLPLLPCVTNAVSEPGRLHLSCEVAQVPEELLRQVNRRIAA